MDAQELLDSLTDEQKVDIAARAGVPITSETITEGDRIILKRRTSQPVGFAVVHGKIQVFTRNPA